MPRPLRFGLEGAAVVLLAILLAGVFERAPKSLPLTPPPASSQGAAAVYTPSVRTFIADAAQASVIVTEPDPTIMGITDSATTAQRRRRCPGADMDTSTAPLRAAQRAIRCLINAERAARGIRAVRPDSALARSALRHAGDMVRRQYFRHDTLGGGNFATRILDTGYVPPRKGFVLGENLGWGAGVHATPRALVRAWMASPPHRANILNRGYREIGIGVKKGAPIDRDLPGSVTVATNYGTVVDR